MQLEITVLNWEKYNPKRDQKTYTWFKLQNNFPFSVSMEQLDFKKKWMVICLLCEASRHNKGTFTTSTAILSRISSIEKDDIIDILSDIQKTSIISMVSITRQDDVVDTTPRIDKNRVEKNISIAHPDFDIDALYELYPRKIGKKKGLAICKRVIKNETDYDRVRLAIGNYAAWIREEKKEAQFIKHFSTFMNSWEDWIDFTRKAEIKPIFNFDEDSNV